MPHGVSFLSSQVNRPRCSRNDTCVGARESQPSHVQSSGYYSFFRRGMLRSPTFDGRERENPEVPKVDSIRRRLFPFVPFGTAPITCKAKEWETESSRQNPLHEKETRKNLVPWRNFHENQPWWVVASDSKIHPSPPSHQSTFRIHNVRRVLHRWNLEFNSYKLIKLTH